MIDIHFRKYNYWDTIKGLMTKYAPRSTMTIPAPLRNKEPVLCHVLFSRMRLTNAVELPAMTIGRQWPNANRIISMTPVSTLACTVTMARIGAMNPNVQELERNP
jgi:hypothetical protein